MRSIWPCTRRSETVNYFVFILIRNTMDKQKWKRRFFSNEEPFNYSCPKCRIGALEKVQFHTELTGVGNEMGFNGEPYGLEARFTGLLKCTKPSCAEIVAFGGDCKKLEVKYEENSNGEYIQKKVTTYYPKFFFPNLELFPITEEISEPVSLEINLAFAHYWSDLSSCANRIRTATELILDDLKAPKKKKNKKGDLKKLRTLHERIEHYASRNESLSELLMANKIIGNEGSHSGSLSFEDILDAFYILHVVIDKVYIKAQEKASKIALEINNDKMPRSKK